MRNLGSVMVTILFVGSGCLAASGTDSESGQASSALTAAGSTSICWFASDTPSGESKCLNLTCKADSFLNPANACGGATSGTQVVFAADAPAETSLGSVMSASVYVQRGGVDISGPENFSSVSTKATAANAPTLITVRPQDQGQAGRLRVVYTATFKGVPKSASCISNDLTLR